MAQKYVFTSRQRSAFINIFIAFTDTNTTLFGIKNNLFFYMIDFSVKVSFLSIFFKRYKSIFLNKNYIIMTIKFWKKNQLLRGNTADRYN